MRQFAVFLVVTLTLLAGCTGAQAPGEDGSTDTPFGPTTEEPTEPQTTTTEDRSAMLRDTFYTVNMGLDSPLIDGGVTIAADRVHFAEVIRTREDADRFHFDRFDDDSAADFVNETDYDRATLIVVQTIVQPNCDLVVEGAERRGGGSSIMSVSVACDGGEQQQVRSVGTLFVRVDPSASDVTVELTRDDRTTVIEPAENANTE